MKLRILMFALFAFVLGNTAWAQTADIAGGYSFLNFDAGPGERETIHGWMANASGNVTDHFGIVGDVSGHYEDGFSAHTFMGGVRVNGRTDAFNPFGEVMVGGTRLADDVFSETDLTLGVGGGVDLKVNDAVSVRAVQFDWLPIRADGEWETSVIRMGFGIVVHIP